MFSKHLAVSVTIGLNRKGIYEIILVYLGRSWSLIQTMGSRVTSKQASLSSWYKSHSCYLTLASHHSGIWSFIIHSTSAFLEELDLQLFFLQTFFFALIICQTYAKLSQTWLLITEGDLKLCWYLTTFSGTFTSTSPSMVLCKEISDVESLGSTARH